MVTINGGVIRFSKGPSIKLVDFPDLLLRHLDSDPTTPCVESFGERYVKAGFPVSKTKALVSAVCKWGGDNRISFKALRDNHVKTIASSLKQAHVLLLAGDPEGAIKRITQLKRVGISYGSKHLKFLAADHAVVLDRIIRKKYGYKESAEAFAQFIEDCGNIRDQLNQTGIAKPNGAGLWRVSDVEMAVFAKAAKL